MLRLKKPWNGLYAFLLQRGTALACADDMVAVVRKTPAKLKSLVTTHGYEDEPKLK